MEPGGLAELERDIDQVVADEHEFHQAWQERHDDVLARHPHLGRAMQDLGLPTQRGISGSAQEGE